MKKLNMVAAVLAAVGVIAAVYSSMYSDANALLNLPLCIAYGIVGIALCLVPIFVKHDLVGLACELGSIAALMAVLNMIISERILMIAGIFSYNSQDQIGWTVFYIVIAAAVGIVLSIAATVTGGFLSNKK